MTVSNTALREGKNAVEGAFFAEEIGQGFYYGFEAVDALRVGGVFWEGAELEPGVEVFFVWF